MKVLHAADAYKVLSETGLLFLLNAVVLHPFGYALCFQFSSEHDDSKDPTIVLLDATDDPEGWVFDEESFEAGKVAFQKWFDDVGVERIATRFRSLWFIVQSDGILRATIQTLLKHSPSGMMARHRRDE